jgi:ppGpp synthetase/RelA/SpoT-type nucleotidyltranferase
VEPISRLEEHARQAATSYRTAYPEHEACAQRIAALLTAWLDAEGINYLAISARAKSVDSFRAKAARAADDGTSPRYPNPLADITDLIGARVITYLPESVDRTCDILRSEFEVHEDVDKGERTKQRGGFGYASRHFLVRLDASRAGSLEYKSLKDKIFEIQVRTAAQHAWAEFEHDVRYKVAIPEARRAEFDRRFTLAAALVELADNEFAEIDRLYREVTQQVADEVVLSPFELRSGLDQPATNARQERENTTSLNESELATWLTERYRDAPMAKKEHYLSMINSLRACAVNSLADLDRLLNDVDSAKVNKSMKHVIPAGHVRRLEDDLLAALGQAYVDRTARSDHDRAALLHRRLSKLKSLG